VSVAANGEVTVVRAGSTKLTTKSDGIDVTGEVQCDTLDVDGAMDVTGTATFHNNIHLQDNDHIYVGSGFDIDIYHDGSHSYVKDNGTGNLKLVSNGTAIQIEKSDGENMAIFRTDGACELYHNNAKKFETTSGGVSINGDLDLSNELNLMGGSDGAKYIDARVGSGGTLTIRGTLGGDANHSNLATFTRNGAVNLYHAGGSKLQTKTDGVNITGELECDSLDVDGAGDFTGGVNFRGGTGAVDVKAGSDIRLEAGNWTGESAGKIQHHGQWLYIQGGSSGHIFRDYAGQDRALIDGTGLRPGLNNTFDLGTSSYRWRNVYTNDLNLSNEGSANDVDGTWGSWTIQEGEDDLFLLNRRSGKKYKFNLTEVN
jgi:hypothetical protein